VAESDAVEYPRQNFFIDLNLALGCDAQPSATLDRFHMSNRKMAHVSQNSVVRRRARLFDGPMALPENKQPKSMTSNLLELMSGESPDSETFLEVGNRMGTRTCLTALLCPTLSRR
jgi:hypothetical protein